MAGIFFRRPLYRKFSNINMSPCCSEDREPAPSLEGLAFFCLQGQECASLVQGLCICIYAANKIEQKSTSQGDRVQAHAAAGSRPDLNLWFLCAFGAFPTPPA